MASTSRSTAPAWTQPSPASSSSPASSDSAASGRTSSRRRQRSTRLVVASLLVTLGAVVVVVAALVGSFPVLLVAAGLAVVLGGAGVRITWSEVVMSRRWAARDRAAQARDYLGLTETRTAEQAIYVADTQGRITRLEAVVSRLESRLADAAAEAAEANRLLAAERERAQTLESERDRASSRLDEAEDRAAQAIVRVAELEQELDVVLAEWRAGAASPQRKHA